MLKQLYQHRKYILKNSFASCRFRYAGTALGVFWNVINPLLTALIYVVVFQQLLGYRTGGQKESYALFLIAGLFPWMSFANLISAGGKAFLRNANILRVVNIPPVVFVAIEFMASFIELNIYFMLMVVIYSIFGLPPTLLWLLLPFFAFLFLLLGFFITVVIANLQVLFEDVSEFTQHVVRLWRWTMPVMYTLDSFPAAFHIWMRINPPYTFIDAIRNIILNNSLPTAFDWLLIAVWLVIFGLISSFVNRKLEPEIRDYL